MCVELPSKRSANGFYIEPMNGMAHVRNALERKLEFNPIKTDMKWPIPFKRQERRETAQNFSISRSATQEYASCEYSFGSMAYKYFSFAYTVLVLVCFFAFSPEISAMVTSAVNITKPLKRIYPQIRVCVCFFFFRSRRCYRIYFFFNLFTKISHAQKNSTKTFWPCFQLFFFTPRVFSLLLRIKLLLPEMLSAWHFLLAIRDSVAKRLNKANVKWKLERVKQGWLSVT